MRKAVSSLITWAVAMTLPTAPPVACAEAAAQGEAQATKNEPGASNAAPPKKMTSSQSQANATTLGSIVVTATRRSESLQKVPLPVSVLSYHDIEREHLQGFADYAASIPGLNYTSAGPGLTNLTIRGISSGSQQSNATVGIYVDDTPYGSSDVLAGGGFRASALEVPDIDPADLERVEVLSGPQGTLYGAGALGGVIRFITIPPDTENLSGRLQIGGSSVDGGGYGFSTKGMVNVPLVKDNLALRVNVYDTTTPGFIDDAGLGKKDINESRVKGGRASLLWTPTNQTSLRVTAQAENLNSDGQPIEALDPTTLRPVYGDLQQRIAGDSGFYDGRFQLYNATFKSDFGWATLMSSTSYSTLNSTLNVDETPFVFPGYQPNGQPYSVLGTNQMHQTRATQEIRLTSPKSQTVEWLGGLIVDHQIATPNQFFYAADYSAGTELPSPIGNLGYDTNSNAYIAYAAYGNLTWHVTDRFDLEAGLRYSHDRQHYVETGNGILVGVDVPTTLVDQHSSDSTTTYSLTPSFHIDDNTLLYARAASGFLPGGPNNVDFAVPGIPTSFGPTKLTDYELGLKSTSWNDRLIANLSAYYINWTKIQLASFINPDSFISNGGQAKSEGLEASIQVIPVRGLKFSANAAVNDAELTKNAPPPTNGEKGDTLPYAPHFTLGLHGDYDFDLGGYWHGYVGASYLHVGARKSDFAAQENLQRLNVPSYNTLGLRAGVSCGDWSIDAYIKNVSNERGVVAVGDSGTAIVNPITGGNEANVTIVTPRLIGISVTKTF